MFSCWCICSLSVIQHSWKRVILLKHKSRHFILMFRTLRWLLTSLKIKSRVLMMVFKATHVLAPGCFLTFPLFFPCSPVKPHGLLVFPWKAELLLTFSSLYLLFPLPRMLYSQIFLWLTPLLYSDITKILKPLLRFSLTTLFKTAHAWTHVHLYMPVSTYDCMTCILICFFPQLEC